MAISKSTISKSTVFKSTKCSACGKTLTFLQQQCGDVCEKLACRGPRLHEQSRIAKAREIESRRAVREGALEKLKKQSPRVFQVSGLNGEQALMLVVPSFSEELEPMTDQRRSRFEARLDTALAEAQDMHADIGKHRSMQMQHANYHSQESSLAVVNACSTCRGYCCKNGGDHAFLNAEFLAWRMLDQPEATADELKAEYMALVPERHYPNSCLFHSLEGCVLPRSIRGTTCNWFECTGIAEHNATLEANSDQPTIAIAHNEEAAVLSRIGIMDAEGNRREIVIDEPFDP